MNTNSQVEDASLVKTAETAVSGIVVKPVTNLVKGTGNILTGDFKEGFTQLGEGVTGPVVGTVETVSEAVKTVLKAGDSILDVFFGSEINSEKSNQNSVAVQMYNKGQNNK